MIYYRFFKSLFVNIQSKLQIKMKMNQMELNEMIPVIHKRTALKVTQRTETAALVTHEGEKKIQNNPMLLKSNKRNFKFGQL